MKLRRFLTNRLILTVSALFFAVILSCGNGDGPVGPENGGGPGSWTPSYACADAEQAINDVPDRNAPNLGFDNAVVITFTNDGVNIVDPEDQVSFVSDGGHITIRNKTAIPGDLNVVLSGSTSNGSFKIHGDFAIMRLNLYLNGINITNPDGPAINTQNGSRIRVITTHLVGGCDRANRITGREDVTPPSNEDAKGAFFSESRVVFTGTGSLEVRSKRRHAIAIDNSVEINNGNIIIHESPIDGLHANDEILISGGTLQFKTVGDAIQNKRNAPIRITGGKLTLWTTGIKSHGIACDSNDVIITGSPTINITTLGNGSKGIRSRAGVEIGGGTIGIKTYGHVDITPVNERNPSDPDTTSRAAGIKSGEKGVIISGGTLTIVSSGDRSRGINSDGDVTISGGDIDINANNDGINVGDTGYFIMSGGNVKARAARSGQDIDCKDRHNITGGTLDATLNGRKGGG
jgi:hypothetical protein